MRLDFSLIDVFTRTPFGGSRLTLFRDGGQLPAVVRQRIAREMCTGETAFVDANGDGAVRLRVHTPRGEVPLSVLSVIGATCGMDAGNGVHAGNFSWLTEAGPFEVSRELTDDGVLYWMEHEPAEFIGQYYQRGRVARTLGIDEREIAITGLPCEIVSTGLPIHIVPVGSLEAVWSIKHRYGAAREIAGDLGFGDLFVFTCETKDPAANVHCRMFAHSFGIPEDAATGGAAGALLAYMVKHRLVPEGDRARIVIEQGLEMKRPSRLHAEAEVRGGKTHHSRIGGHCVLLGEGSLHFDPSAVI